MLASIAAAPCATATRVCGVRCGDRLRGSSPYTGAAGEEDQTGSHGAERLSNNGVGGYRTPMTFVSFFPGNLRTTMVYGYSIFSEIITLYMACLPLPVTPGGVAAGGIAPEHQEADERTAASSVRPSLHHVTTSAQRTLQFRRLTRQRSFLLVLDYTNQERNVLPASVRCWRKGTGVEAIHLT